MAKKSMLQRELKRQILVKKYASKSLKLKNSLKKSISIDEKLRISAEIQKLPKNSSKVRLKNRCWKTGRPRGYFRFFWLVTKCFKRNGSSRINSRASKI